MIQAACVSSAGQVRRQNEDHYLLDFKCNLFIVSDGMGGHPAGDVASLAVVTVLPAILEQKVRRIHVLSPKRRMQALRDAILELSQLLRTESSGRVSLQGLGATVVVVWLCGSMAYLGHMGDSRIYLLRQERLTQMTEDHSVIALLLRYGEITPEEGRLHSARGQLTRYVGMEGDVYPDVQTVELQKEDRLLLCSDGLTNMVPDEQMAQILRETTEAKVSCQALVRAANVAGGTDNITTLVVNYG